MTPGFNLPYKYVIHVLSPIYDKVEDPRQELIHTYYNVFELARKNNFKKIAIPLLSGNHHRYPFSLALKWAKEAFETHKSDGLQI